jgi:hypothetical protein
MVCTIVFKFWVRPVFHLLDIGVLSLVLRVGWMKIFNVSGLRGFSYLFMLPCSVPIFSLVFFILPNGWLLLCVSNVPGCDVITGFYNLFKYVPLIEWYIPARVYCITPQKTVVIFIGTVMRTSHSYMPHI